MDYMQVWSKERIKMNNLFELAENYDKNKHLMALIRTEDNIMERLTLIFDSAWKTMPENAPVDVLTFLLDSYYVMPERPDMASLFAWQAINRIYNEISMKRIADRDKRPRDLEGILNFIDEMDKFDNKYYVYMQPYYDKLSEKIYRFVANYIINGMLVEGLNTPKYTYLLYRTLRSSQMPLDLRNKYDELLDVISMSYLCAAQQYMNPRIENGKFVKNKPNETAYDRKKLRLIIGNMAKKLKELIVSGSTNIQLKDMSNTNKTINFTEKERFGFVLIGILYASRCNNLHGNVESRMNSPYADKETFITYTDIYLLEYMVVAIGLVMNGQMDKNYLSQLADNYQLLIE